MNAKEVEKKQIQRNQERAEDESLFKAKEVDQNELMKSLHLKLKKLIRSKNNLKKETEKKNQRDKKTDNESLLKAKEAKKKQIQMNQERVEDESLFKAKKVDRK